MVFTSCLQAELKREAAAPWGLPRLREVGFLPCRHSQGPSRCQSTPPPPSRPPGPSCFFFLQTKSQPSLGPRLPTRSPQPQEGCEEECWAWWLLPPPPTGGPAFPRHQEACLILGCLDLHLAFASLIVHKDRGLFQRHLWCTKTRDLETTRMPRDSDLASDAMVHPCKRTRWAGAGVGG